MFTTHAAHNNVALILPKGRAAQAQLTLDSQHVRQAETQSQLVNRFPF